MILLDDKTGKIEVLSNFVNEELNELLISQFDLKQEYIQLFGKRIAQPRLSRLFGDRGVEYKYSGQLFEASAWTPFLLELKQQLYSDYNLEFNSALVNYYRDGNDSMGLHADNEKELGKNPTIASVSIGGARKLVFKSIDKKRKIEIEIQNGDLILMSGALQHHWKHEIPKSKQSPQARLNVTYRKVYQ